MFSCCCCCFLRCSQMIRKARRERKEAGDSIYWLVTYWYSVAVGSSTRSTGVLVLDHWSGSISRKWNEWRISGRADWQTEGQMGGQLLDDYLDRQTDRQTDQLLLKQLSASFLFFTYYYDYDTSSMISKIFFCCDNGTYHILTVHRTLQSPWWRSRILQLQLQLVDDNDDEGGVIDMVEDDVRKEQPERRWQQNVVLL